MIRRLLGICLALGVAVGVSACGYTPGERALTGGALGAGAGAAIGAASGGSAGAGALIGGGVGALGGALTAP
jgi:osmotically inducible lipoprotein OsmB